MSGGFPGRVVARLMAWQPPVLLDRMFSVVTYGRVIARAFVNSVSPETLSLPGLTRRCFGNYSASSAASVSSAAPAPCKLVSVVCGFSKFDSPISNRRRVPPTVTYLCDKRHYGDDSCFLTFNKATDVFGVADGVGGWREYGIDPSQFSKKLMKNCETLVAKDTVFPCGPKELLATAYKELLEDKVLIQGSSTACIVMMDRKKQTLSAANLGDSGFMVVRQGSVLLKSSEQQHFFNTPYQLSMPPESERDNVLHDQVEDADETTINLEIGDIILTATDGLFDNVPDSLILQELAKLENNSYENIKAAAWSIAECARDLSYDPDYMSPFAKKARQSGYNVTGGKVDDITVLLSMVTPE